MKKKFTTKSLIKNVALWLILFIIGNIICLPLICWASPVDIIKIIKAVVLIYAITGFTVNLMFIAFLVVDFFLGD